MRRRTRDSSGDRGELKVSWPAPRFTCRGAAFQPARRRARPRGRLQTRKPCTTERLHSTQNCACELAHLLLNGASLAPFGVATSRIDSPEVANDPSREVYACGSSGQRHARPCFVLLQYHSVARSSRTTGYRGALLALAMSIALATLPSMAVAQTATETPTATPPTRRRRQRRSRPTPTVTATPTETATPTPTRPYGHPPHRRRQRRRPSPRHHSDANGHHHHHAHP